MRGLVVLLSFSALAAATAGQAQTTTNAPSYHYPLETGQFLMATPEMSRPITSANHEQAMSSLRERVATGMIRKGRCSEAARYAERQNDKILAERVNATCAAVRSPRLPT